MLFDAREEFISMHHKTALWRVTHDVFRTTYKLSHTFRAIALEEAYPVHSGFRHGEDL